MSLFSSVPPLKHSMQESGELVSPPVPRTVPKQIRCCMNVLNKQRRESGKQKSGMRSKAKMEHRRVCH